MHLSRHMVDYTSSIRGVLCLVDLILVTTKLISTSIITSIVVRVDIVIICTLMFVRLIISFNIIQLIAYILRYIEPLVLFKTILLINFNHLSIDVCDLPFIVTKSIGIPRSNSPSSLYTASTNSSLASYFPSTTR